jgi:putative copper export protein
MAAFLVHYVFLFALALWVGGGAAISFIVAPAVFERAGSRRLAGEIVGQVLRRFDIYVLVAGPLALLLGALEMAGTVGAARTLTLQLGLVAGMVGLALYSRFALTPEIRKLRDQLGDQIDQIPREDPRRRAFGRLHGFSVLCLLGEILLGALAMGTTVMLLTARPG